MRSFFYSSIDCNRHCVLINPLSFIRESAGLYTAKMLLNESYCIKFPRYGIEVAVLDSLTKLLSVVEMGE